MLILERTTDSKNRRWSSTVYLLKTAESSFFITQQLSYEWSIFSNGEIFYTITIERRNFNSIRFIIDE